MLTSQNDAYQLLEATMTSSNSSSAAGAGSDLLHKPSSVLKKEGWSGLMRDVRTRGIVVVTNRSQPEAVVLSVGFYLELERLAQREKMRGAQQLAELSACFDQRLALLNTPQSHQALNAFMEPLTREAEPGQQRPDGNHD